MDSKLIDFSNVQCDRYFVKDINGTVHFVMVHDKAQNADGGLIRLLVDSPDLGGVGAQITLFDDPAATNKSAPGDFYGCVQIVLSPLPPSPLFSSLRGRQFLPDWF